jgi:hypothetical protein
MNFRSIAFILNLIAIGLPAIAWEHDTEINDTICDIDTYTYGQTTLSDGQGGCYVLWEDDRHTGHRSIYAQHLDSNGMPLWDENGICAISVDANISSYNAVVGGTNDLWIVASHLSTGISQIYCQRVNNYGEPAWDLTGIRVTPSINSQQSRPSIICDELGGAIITWEDTRNFGASHYDIYAQRIYYNGLHLWGYEGIAVCNESREQSDPRITLAVPGSAIIIWQDDRNSGDDIYGDLLDSNGVSQWAADGILVMTDTSLEDIAPDGFGGVFIVGINSYNISIKRIAQNGTYWYHYDVCNQEDSQASPILAPDGNGGTYVIWEDYRDDYYDGRTIYGQKISGGGYTMWTTNGIVLLAESRYQDIFSGCATTSEDGDLLFTARWFDNLLSQKVSSNGSLLWGSSGVITA